MLAPEGTATPIQPGVADGATVGAGDGATVVEVEGGTVVAGAGASVVEVDGGTVVAGAGATVVEVDGAAVDVVVVLRQWPALSERPQLAVAGIIASNAVPPISNRIELARIGPP